MLLETGVDLSRLRPEIRKRLNMMCKVYREFSDGEMIITSTYEGSHSPGSLHYANLAIAIKSPEDVAGFANGLRANLSDKYDVVPEGDHIRVEYDPDVIE